MTYKNDPWHRECFTCTHCDKSLAGQRFTSKDEKPYCAECFGELFAKRCTACTKPITGWSLLLIGHFSFFFKKGNFSFLKFKVLAALDSSLSKTAIGTTIVSSALVATRLWSEKDLSLTVPTSSVRNAPSSAFSKNKVYNFSIRKQKDEKLHAETLEGGRGKMEKFL